MCEKNPYRGVTQREISKAKQIKEFSKTGAPQSKGLKAQTDFAKKGAPRVGVSKPKHSEVGEFMGEQLGSES